MRLRGLLIAGMTCTLAFGTAASAEAKPHDAKAKQCAKHPSKPRCDSTGPTAASEPCPSGYELATVIELGPGAEAHDANDNGSLCWSATLPVVDDAPGA